MENSILLLIFSVILCRIAVSEKIGPAIVIRNDVQQQNGNSNSPTGPPRTTTVYGFLDFTTTIDNTVVVFRPSSASVKSPATVSISSSKSEKATLPIAATKTRQVMTATVTLHPNQNRTVIRKDRPIIRLDKVDKRREEEGGGGGGGGPLVITPTPTIARTNNVVQNSRRVTSSSLAEKRRRFLAIARGQRPVGPPLSSKNNVATVQSTGDQEMAESIEVAPSKIKRFQSLSNYSTLYSLPGGRGGGGGGGGSGGVGRILVRKLQRRLGRQPIETADKSQVVAFRRPNSKLNLLTVAGSRAREEVAEPNVELASSLNSISSSESSSDLDVASRSLTSSSSDGSVATITEYVHDGAEVGAESGPLQSSILPLSSNEDGENGASAIEDLEASQTDVGALSSASVTVPLPVLKAATDKNDIGLTVPLQLSIVTSTFSLTETRLRTSLLPVYDGTSTTFYTLTHSFVVTKTVTTFQTVPPEEYMHYLIPGNDSALNSLNDVLPELESMPPSLLQRKADLDEDGGPHTNDPEDVGSDELLEKAGTVGLDVETNDPKADTATASGDAATNSELSTNPSNNPAFPQQMGQPVNPLLGNLPFLNLLGPAAALGLNPYFPYGLGLPQVLTTSRPVFSTDVVYTSKLLPIIDGLTTTYRTLHEAASTITRTSYETFTTQVANQNPLAGLGGNNLQQTGPQGMSTVTSPHTFVTTETQTATQVFKLMYDGYKTSYRTVSSTSLVTRTITTHTTTTVPIYNTMMPFFG